MKIIVTKENLALALNKTTRAASARSAAMPIMANVLLEADQDKLTLTATDSEIVIKTWIPALVEEAGATTLPAKKFQQIIGALPSADITIETDAMDVSSISCKSSRYKMNGMSADGFSVTEQIQYDWSFKMKIKEIIRGFVKVNYAKSNDDSRKQLNGVVMSIRSGIMTIAATDGRRLAAVENTIEDDGAKDGDYILPSRASTEISSCLDGDDDVIVSISNSNISFQTSTTVLSTKLVEGNYPNFRQVIPENCGCTVSVSRVALSEALKRVSLIVTDSAESVKLTFTKNLLTIFAASAETGESSETLEIAYEAGDEVTVSFNPVFFLDPLKVMEADNINIEFGKQYSPIKLTGDEGFLYMLMPMKG